ncbi:hypothetical protein AQPE_2817 [Aquipluma nitroreducens]|uniref:Uncharacterized protein n=1 Tax=Aquipluma nitroreducens TaxID=2010828 RepID=A0A5K7SBH2_9BACT|nr:hypothetical protein [Aquipluma nitroreducens]MDD2307642.1 hypothetical protein [Prolixibacteraceae bacterium]BBE18654.1 hypothetical protein AQPE_2817 [Aquipluma nitroreducens]
METKPTNISFSLQKVTTEQFAIIEEGFEEKGNIRVGINLRFAADDAKNMIAVFTAFNFDSNQKPFIIIEAGCHFMIEKEAWDQMFKAETNALNVPKGFLSHMTMITVGTARGILHAKTENTCFNKYVLPTVNVSEMIKEDVSFSFDH